MIELKPRCSGRTFYRKLMMQISHHCGVLRQDVSNATRQCGNVCFMKVLKGFNNSIICFVCLNATLSIKITKNLVEKTCGTFSCKCFILIDIFYIHTFLEFECNVLYLEAWEETSDIFIILALFWQYLLERIRLY